MQTVAPSAGEASPVRHRGSGPVRTGNSTTALENSWALTEKGKHALTAGRSHFTPEGGRAGGQTPGREHAGPLRW